MTTTVASFSPSVAVSTGVLNSYVVPLGKSATLPIESCAFGVEPGVTVCALAVGSFLSASVRGSLTVTLTGTSSVEPSGYVTTTVASFSPSVAVSTGVLNSYVVPLGKSATLPIESCAFGVEPGVTVCALAVGSFLSASVRNRVASTGSLATDVLPATSVAVAVTFPAGISTVGVIVALPSAPAVASPILLPSLS